MTTRRPARPTIGYQPGLDGLRALSVIAVIFYHAGFAWAKGGFLGVEAFFVVSGFLITSLLVDELEGSRHISLGAFWTRRARRLLPALIAVITAVACWAAVAGTAGERSDLHRDLVPGIFYMANWGQIAGGALYFGNLSPLRHLWSLAVEEQWYLLWPLLFVGLTRRKATNGIRATVVAGVAAAVMIGTWIAASGEPTSSTMNVLYLSTVTRSAGLLAGAAAAFVWRPWRSAGRAAPGARRLLDSVGVFAVVVLAVQAASSTSVVDRGLYQGRMVITTLASLAVVMAVTHPAALTLRTILGWRPLVALGKRSYGLYLWSWPISVFYGAYDGTVPAFVKAMLTTAVVSEVCYRFVEVPVRNGQLRRRLRSLAPQTGRAVRRASLATASTVLVLLVVFYAGVKPHDPAAGGADVDFNVSAVSIPSTDAVPVDGSPTTANASATPAVTTVPPLLRRVVIVGDSQAHALYANLPRGLGKILRLSDGGVDGCGVHDTGTAVSAHPGFTKPLTECAGFDQKWARSARRAKATTALVMLGAWDVLDVQENGQTIVVGTPAGDRLFLTDLGKGLAALEGAGARVALLEIACMRPIAAKGAVVPVLPERGDDARVSHLNKLLRQAAAADPTHVTFIAGPSQWCNDPTISTDTAYRWDGVHVFKAGAGLIMDTIAPALVAITAPT